jgi:hypothetical protein
MRPCVEWLVVNVVFMMHDGVPLVTAIWGIRIGLLVVVFGIARRTRQKNSGRIIAIGSLAALMFVSSIWDATALGICELDVWESYAFLKPAMVLTTGAVQWALYGMTILLGVAAYIESRVAEEPLART